MNEQQDIGEEIAQIVWESSVAFSNPNKPRATKWSDVSTSAARQSARHVASDLLASSVIRRIQAEVLRTLAAKYQAFGAGEVDLMRKVQYKTAAAYMDAEAEAIEGAE